MKRCNCQPQCRPNVGNYESRLNLTNVYGLQPIVKSRIRFPVTYFNYFTSFSISTPYNYFSCSHATCVGYLSSEQLSEMHLVCFQIYIYLRKCQTNNCAVCFLITDQLLSYKCQETLYKKKYIKKNIKHFSLICHLCSEIRRKAQLGKMSPSINLLMACASVTILFPRHYSARINISYLLPGEFYVLI